MIYSRLHWTKPFQAEFWASEFDREIYKICCSACRHVHVTWDSAAQPLLAKEAPLIELRSKKGESEGRGILETNGSMQ